MRSVEGLSNWHIRAFFRYSGGTRAYESFTPATIIETRTTHRALEILFLQKSIKKNDLKESKTKHSSSYPRTTARVMMNNAKKRQCSHQLEAV